MHIARRIWTQLAILTVLSVIAMAITAIEYARLPSQLFGIGHYVVTLQLPQAGGLYERANVTYRGTQVGKVKNVHLTDTGVDAELSMRSDVPIPSNLDARVDSTSSIGEQYVALSPRDQTSAPLRSGDVISKDRTSLPPDINSLLGATNRGLQAIPGDNLKTVIDESYTAVGGLGPEISRLVKGGDSLAIDARSNLSAITNVIDNVAPVLNAQTETSQPIQAWAAHLADITSQLRDNDSSLRGVLQDTPAAADELRQLFDGLQPTLPILLANLANIAPVLVTYNASLEQTLVLVPQLVANEQAIGLANANTKQPYRGGYLSFKLNLNLPPVCTTGFLPATQQRDQSLEDYPDVPPGDKYCRIPQDAPNAVRGMRNLPCITRPGKRAPTVKMCESDEDYIPLNEGFNWKGDPNATYSGQDIPQLPPDTPPAAPAASPDASPALGAAPPPGPVPPIAVAPYDPTTGTYVGPDGGIYTQADLAPSDGKERTWQSMMLPPTGS